MIDDYARIEITHNLLPLGRTFVSFEWKGSPWLPVLIDWRNTDYLKEMPWRLKKIGSDVSWPADVYVRTDRLYWLTGVRVYTERLYRSIRARIVMTAYVWDLAYVPEAVSPAWAHLFKKRPKYNEHP